MAELVLQTPVEVAPEELCCALKFDGDPLCADIGMDSDSLQNNLDQ
jgi:hypothetical protein